MTKLVLAASVALAVLITAEAAKCSEASREAAGL
jgi:hypothetical protein